jgi:glycosyltransferase involved in cell wall biosynthesis
MNVLFASHLFPNPARPLHGVFVAELAAAMASRSDVEVDVFAPVAWQLSNSPGSRIPASRDERGAQVAHPKRWPVPSPLSKFRWMTYASALRNTFPRRTWDVVHSHWMDPDAMAAAHSPRTSRSRLVATIHGHATLGLGLKGRNSPNIRTALLRMDHVVAVSSELRSLLVEDFRIPPERVSVRFNGIDPSRFRYQEKAEARHRLNLPADRKILLHVARFSPEKRHRLLLDALELCPVQDFAVHLVGDGPLRGEIEHEVHRRHLNGRVTFHGGIPHEDLPDWFAAADALCLSSAHEGCPVVIHEALACGTPVVATRVGAVPDLLGTADGVLCTPEDPGALARALQEIWNRAWDRPEIARRGSSHTWQSVADDHVRLYRELTNLDPDEAPQGPPKEWN